MAHEGQQITLTESSAGVARRPYARPPEAMLQHSLVPRGQMIFTLRDEAVSAPTVGNTLSIRISCQLDTNFAYSIRSLNCGIKNDGSGTSFLASIGLLEVINWAPELENTVLGRLQVGIPTLANARSDIVWPYSVSSARALNTYQLNSPIPQMIYHDTATPFVYADFNTEAVSSPAMTVNYALVLDYFDIEQYYSGTSKQTYPVTAQA